MSKSQQISVTTQKDGNIQQDNPEKILADIESESPKVKICITAQQDKTEKIFFTKVLDQYHEFRKIVFVLLIISFLISFLALFIAVYLIRHESPDNIISLAFLNSYRETPNSIQNAVKSDTDKLSNILPFIVDSLTALLSGGGIIIGLKNFFFSSKEYINLMHKPIENESEEVDGTRRVIKRLKWTKNIYALITTIISIIILILVILNFIRLTTIYNDTSDVDDCKLFNDCFSYVKSVNLTVGENFLICPINNNSTSIFNNKLDVCRFVLGCSTRCPKFDPNNPENLYLCLFTNGSAYINTTYINDYVCIPPAFNSQKTFNHYVTNNIVVLALGVIAMILNVCLLIFYFGCFGTAKIRMEKDTKKNLYKLAC
ncbi:12380_t:CDS:1 [Cetraspora pellucida]|uniref:12380_t:CDS:1 n=1 Tax=Cetraspora pellucida TaxID=1433469 RepID=A0A9N9G9L9_9GLOM|nr:12380_t:CDS:1 [Cetraspora pellucida]